MDELVLIPTTSKNTNENGLANVQEVINASAIGHTTNTQVSEKSVERKNLKTTQKNEKKKTANAIKRRSINTTEQKTETDDIKMTAGKSNDDSDQTNNLNGKNLKRKSSSNEESEIVITPETEDKTAEEATNARNVETHENESIEAPKRKYARKEKSQVSTKQKTDDGSKMINRSTKNSKETKNHSAQNSENKTAVHPPISEMVNDSLRNLKKRNGATAEEISKYIDDNYSVNINRIKPHIRKFLQKGVANNLFDQVSGRGDGENFKIKKAEKVNKAARGKLGKETNKVAKRTEKAKVATEKNKKATKSIKKVTKKAEDAKDARPKKIYIPEISSK